MENIIYFDHVTITVPNVGTGLVKSVIQYTKKLAGNPKRLLGIQTSCNQTSTGTIADASISVNGAGTICEPVNRGIADKSDFIPVNIELPNNSIVTGHVEDLGIATAPFTVTITFKLSK
jgi:hypothetical protein